LRNLLQIEVNHFAFPYGSKKACGDRDFNLARSAGFTSGVTTEDAPISHQFNDPFRLPRISIRNNDSIMTFDARVSGLRKMANKALKIQAG
jgi:hypothetical protein